MGKFPFKRPRIISKKFPGMSSHIDGVTKSLEGLVFSYTEKVDRTLQKKHLMMAVSSMVLLVVLGSFISPKGKADSSIFYPETCLGGWINPRHAEGDLQTTSNGDDTQFNANNSAILPKNTNAQMYCGNFKGTFDAATKPTKIIVSLALTKGADVLLENTIVSDSFASSSGTILDTSSTTDVSFTLSSSTELKEKVLGASTSTVTSSTVDTSTTTLDASTTEVIVATTTVDIATSSLQEPSTIVKGIIESVKDTFGGLFQSDPPKQETDTVVVPPPVSPTESAPAPESVPTGTTDTPPVSFLDNLLRNFFSYVSETVFAEVSTTTMPDVTEDVSSGSSTTDGVDTSSSSPVVDLSATTTTFASTSLASTTEGTTTDASVSDATTTDTNQFQNNFLEVFYTFDGVTWTSLGELNEISMKYRTFEIPVTASTSWNDMSQLQIKIESKKHMDETPTVYLDGIKVEVLYESVQTHAHPDFARDTILKDEIIDGIRMVTIINNDTNEKEIWYMSLDATSTEEVASVFSSSTELLTLSSSSENLSSSTDASSSVLTDGSSTVVTPVVVNLLKKTWKKYEGKDVTIAAAQIVAEIKKTLEKERIEALPVMPDFASDTIKKMKGVFLDTVAVQVERGTGEDVRDELWLYNTEKNLEERIDVSSTSPASIAPDSPLGVKAGYLFWLSVDKKTVYAFNLSDKKIAEQPLPTFDASKGERAEITFENISWKVIVTNEGFSFFSPFVGEVFSDEDSRIVEALRSKMGLDTVLNKEELSKLSLPVEAGDDIKK